ncbi:MAG: BBP7 family outer membrane beta-barrel protein [Pirellulaceae bacterium]|nr:BBP7 family outer membrane beta-barrel protein [Pirellulaceae bacterium]
MKCLWRFSLAWLGLAMVSTVASAQTGWDQPSMVAQHSILGTPTSYQTGNDFSPPNQNRGVQSSPSYSQVPQAPYFPDQPQYGHASNQSVGSGSQQWGPRYGQNQPGYSPASYGSNQNHANQGYRQETAPGALDGIHQGSFGSGYGAGQNWGEANLGAGQQSYFNPAHCGNGNANCATVQGRGPNARNFVIGAGGLVFFRDYEDDIGLSGNGLGQSMFSTDARFRGLGGVELFAQSRNANGRGFEARYWGLFSGCGGTFISDSAFTNLDGLSEIQHDPAGTNVRDVFNIAGAHELCRSNQIHNFEVNRLINAGSFNGLGCRTVNYELLHGARWFQFDEQFEYTAVAGVAPTRLDYTLDANNTLLGYQVGGRGSHGVSDRLQLISGVRFGLFNNRIRHRQRMSDEIGFTSYINSGPFSGTPYDFSSTKNDLATVGEIDLGLGYLLTNSCRATIGYRLIGVTGVALAPDQIPVNFTDVNQIERINSNGSLLLHGFYGGLNFCF